MTGTNSSSSDPDSKEPASLLEQERINNAVRYIQSAGFTFSEELLKDYYICLKTKPFVILAGMSGTGKTQITRLFAKAIHAHYTLISVSSSWTSDTDLLGYFDKNTGVFRETRFVQRDPGRAGRLQEGRPRSLFFVCLDEMNLRRGSNTTLPSSSLRHGRIHGGRPSHHPRRYRGGPLLAPEPALRRHRQHGRNHLQLFRQGVGPRELHRVQHDFGRYLLRRVR